MSKWLWTAKALNRIGVPYPYLNHIACASTSILSEIKFEVTDRCNLACNFCHQGFGEAGGTTALDMDVFERYLAAAKKERIGVVRLTGGEPLVLKSIDRYLRRAKELGFAVIVNTNGTGLTEKRLVALKDMLDCVKISLPAPDERTTTEMTGNKNAWRKKWEAIGLLERHGVNTHILTVMTTENIARFDEFIALLEDHPALRWKPLRAEAQVGGHRPVTRDAVRALAQKLREVRTRERWKDLQLGLGTPFCALEDPAEALEVFGGAHACGPFESLTVTSDGTLARCYSRRDTVDPGNGLRNASRALAAEDFSLLPEACRNCPYALWCRGGCRNEWTLSDTPYGRMDYLADPSNVPGAEAFVVHAAKTPVHAAA